MPFQPSSMFSVAVDGWTLGCGAIRALPRLFASAFLLVAAISFPLGDGNTAQGLAMPTVAGHLLDEARYIASTLVIASVLIGVHRFALLEDQTDRFVWTLPRSYVRFAGSLVVLNSITLPVTLLGSLFRARYFGPFGVLLLVCVIMATFLFARTVLLFPALALGAPYARWQSSWLDTNGHVWRMVGTVILAFIPAVFIAVLFLALAVAIALSFAYQGRSPLPPLAIVVGCGTLAAFSLLVASIGAVIASRYFQAYGDALLKPLLARS